MSGRERGPNYTNEEKITLLNIIKQYKHIIECKKTDTVSWKDKESAWIKITDKFNSASPNFVKRTKQSLQKFYENKKKEIRKTVASNQNDMLKTGGGTVNPKIDPAEDIILDIVNRKTVTGLSNNFDGDSNIDDSIINICPAAETEENIFTVIEDNDVEKNLDLDMGENLDTTKLYVTEPETLTDVQQSSEINWGNTSGKQLKIPVSKKLAAKIKTHDWSPRRRPTIQPLHSTHLSKQYSDLATVKLELARLQKDAFIADTQARQEREKEEFGLKKRSLELDIKIKQIQLKKLSNEF